MKNEHPPPNDDSTNRPRPFIAVTSGEFTPKEKREPRVGGGLLLLLGAALGYFEVFRPLQDAAHHASVSVSMEVAFFTPLLLIHGLVLLFFPRFALRHTGGYGVRRSHTIFGWIYFASLLVLCFGFWSWVRAQLQGLGYNF